MFNVDPPELTVASAVTVYTLSTPAIVNTSPAWGAAVRPSTASVPPLWLPPFTKTVP